MVLLLLLLTLLSLILGYFLNEWWTKWRNLPPGPYGLPYIGYVRNMKPGRLWETYIELAKTYGPIFSHTAFGTTQVILNDWDDVLELYGRSDTAQRPDTIFRFFTGGGKNAGLLSSHGRVWLENRRFAIRSLRDFGFGKSSLNDVIMTEVKYMVQFMSQHLNEPVNIDSNLNVAILNVMWRMIADNFFNQDDPMLNEFFKKFTTSSNSIRWGIFSRLIFMKPRLVFWRTNEILKRFDTRVLPLQNAIGEHKSTREKSFNRDFIDAYLQEAEKRKEPEIMNEEQLYYCVHNLFLAGSETTSTTIRWAVLLLASNPPVQRKLHEEIDGFMKDFKRDISLDDRGSLNYLEAAIMEVLRVANVVPSVVHVCIEEVQYKGYIFPKGTWIDANMYGIHMNPAYWPNPEQFRPERFLDGDGKAKTGKIRGFLPFGLGKRQCLGDVLARMELFLFLAYFLYNFEFQSVPGETLPSLQDTLRSGPIMRPPSYRVIVKGRR